MVPRPGGWSQVLELEPGSGAGARAQGLKPGIGSCSQVPGAGARAWGLEHFSSVARLK